MPHNNVTFLPPGRFNFDELNGKLIEINGYQARILCCKHADTFCVQVILPPEGERALLMHLTETEVNAIQPSFNPAVTDYILQWPS